MVAPKPRVISLEPIARRPKRQRTAKGKESSPKEPNDPSSGSEARAASSPKPEEGSRCDSVDHTANPRSPTPSEVHSVHSAATSVDSTVSSSTGLSFRLGPVPSSARSATGSPGNSSKASLSEKTITATIECLRAGCLPGDNIPLKISIKHSKAMKSMHGIIITLYRQGRIDSAPPLSLFKDIKGKQAEILKHEEYYPKSKTGLGGLSLTSAGSSSMFRKDLAQTFAPILVDPISLTAVINASVRVPEDAFPTISGVPGQMITFKYMVEVVVDLGGKLAGQRSHVPRVGAVTPFGATSTNSRGDSNSSMLATWGGSIVDTDHIRREKSVVACLFEIVVGSTDSARRRGRGNSSVTRQSNDWPVDSPNSTPRNEATHEESFAPMGPVAEHVDDQNPCPYSEPPYEEYPAYYHHPQYDYSRDHPYAQEPRVPPPDVQDDTLNEKERLRRAEERLLPSQPPLDPEQASSRPVVAPSAPSAHPLESVNDFYDDEADTPFAGPSAPPFSNHDHHVDLPTAPPPGPSAPPLEDLHSSTMNHSTDKQELERLRLLTEASAPVEFAPDEEVNPGEGSSRSAEQNHAPSAPVLDDEDDYGVRYAHGAISRPVDEHLPRYER
ncbi:hypothetical protein BJ875DRAFT_456293 [Amylocarpus encephaloides]|uniref:Arrestin C-terminal-like domain-containing protein n=1 Tax=Amylocarpus encephaloides TaxID=45428 RepID=A0A9P7YMY6_9HELO|nr:hypothetical protein BJ875DRAFT_456293 [Amylocarpus encephaloides]